MRRTWPAAVTLFFGAALIPETVVTFNSPSALLLLITPVRYLFLCAFYGSAALLVREYLRRRPARWTGVLLLGAAAGALNEGIIAGTWYQVQYPGYAMIGPVDPAVAAGLTVFHALVSTVVPILLAELIHPQVASRPWLRPRGMAGYLVLLAATVAVGLGQKSHQGEKWFVMAGVAALVLAALALPASPRPAPAPAPAPAPGLSRPVPTRRRLLVTGAAATISFYGLFSFLPAILAATVPPAGRVPSQFLLIALMCGFAGLVIATARRWTGRAGWGQRQTLAVISGLLVPPIAVSVLLPWALVRLEPLITLPVLALLIWLYRKYRQPEFQVRR